MAAMKTVKHAKQFVLCIATVAAALLSGNALANETVATAVEQYVRAQTKGLPGRVEITVAPLDPRTQVAACSALDPFTPGGNRLWGKTMVGVRCLAPTAWTIYVPVQVRVFGPYLVTNRAISAGQILSAADLDSRDGDLTLLPTGIITAPAQGIGKSLKNSVAGGQPLRAEMLLSPPVVQQGQDVGLIYKGSGFAVSNEGKALNTAADGQMARARTGSGQTVSGIARPGGIIEIGP